MSAPALPTPENPIIFYDLKCATPNQCWSPHCWKTRLVLQVKGVPFRTVWVSYPDIKPTVGHIQPGAEAPTLPVIQHGEKWIADSWNIIQYLESLYPTPSLLHPSTQAVHFFQSYVEALVYPSVGNYIRPRIGLVLDERGAEYFRRTREKSFGMTLEEAARGQTIDPIRGPLGPIAKNLVAFGPYLGGEQLNYQDLILLGMLLWYHTADPSCVEVILDMYEKDGKKVLREWYGRVKHLAVVKPE